MHPSRIDAKQWIDNLLEKHSISQAKDCKKWQGRSGISLNKDHKVQKDAGFYCIYHVSLNFSMNLYHSTTSLWFSLDLHTSSGCIKMVIKTSWMIHCLLTLLQWSISALNPARSVFLSPIGNSNWFEESIPCTLTNQGFWWCWSRWGEEPTQGWGPALPL